MRSPSNTEFPLNTIHFTKLIHYTIFELSSIVTADLVTTAGEVVTTANVELSTASPTDATITTVELTLAQTLAELKSARPKTKWVVMQDPSESITTTTTTIPSKDKGLIETDYEIAQRLQAEEQKELILKRIQSYDGDDVTIDDTPLSTKSLTIVDYKIYKEGKKSYFQIIIADGNSQMYLTFGKMLKNFDREDLDVLWSIVKARFKKTEPVNYMVTFLKSLI
ncbi:hypothetical protein Tco_1132224 [Tanacetum coccineum]|uniref:Uncharacterized protein n=1 Tax=Tanacetum coccineum TaxID=301880 RepID=A0ABQ5JEC8_9ASTR